jgi:predicted nucleotidyltransferase
LIQRIEANGGQLEINGTLHVIIHDKILDKRVLSLTGINAEAYKSPNQRLERDGIIYAIGHQGKIIEVESVECKNETQKRQDLLPEINKAIEIFCFENNIVARFGHFGSVLQESCRPTSDINIYFSFENRTNEVIKLNAYLKQEIKTEISIHVTYEKENFEQTCILNSTELSYTIPYLKNKTPEEWSIDYTTINKEIK